jgi:hypothetical protein
MMNNLIFFTNNGPTGYGLLLILYGIISFIVLVTRVLEMTNSHNKQYEPERVKSKITLFTLLFPVHFLPHIFNFDLRKLFKNKTLCECKTCGNNHKTFNQRFADIIGLKG